MSSPKRLAKVWLSLAAESMDLAPEALLLDLVRVASLPVCSQNPTAAPFVVPAPPTAKPKVR
jgi:hypothetical protein